MRSPYCVASSLRRRAVGIDLNRRAVRVAIVTRARLGLAVRVEAFDSEPLGPACFGGKHGADWPTIARALGRVLGRTLGGAARSAVPGAMALSDLALTCGSCGGEGTQHARHWSDADARAAVQRRCGFGDEPLAVDWRADTGADSIDFAAASQAEIDARVDLAAACGVDLRVIDAEPSAALRALRYVAGATVHGQEKGGALPGPAPFHALWIGDTGVHGWHVGPECATARVRYPSSEHATLADALRALADHGEARSAWLGGELELLNQAGLSPSGVADLLGCPLDIFAPGMLESSEGQPIDAAPDYVVAFGLALRGAFE